MASLTVTPDQVKEGDQIVITGAGFDPSTVVTVSIPHFGIETEVQSDQNGDISTDDLADRAAGLLTSDATNVTAADTVTIGSVTYTFRAAVAATANEVLIGADAAETLANLKAAINDDTSQQTKYGTATVVNPDVGAGKLTATTLVLFAKTRGTGGNALASTEASTHLSFGGATLAGGAAASGISSLLFSPDEATSFDVEATDGTNEASTRIQVWTS